MLCTAFMELSACLVAVWMASQSSVTSWRPGTHTMLRRGSRRSSKPSKQIRSHAFPHSHRRIPRIRSNVALARFCSRFDSSLPLCTRYVICQAGTQQAFIPSRMATVARSRTTSSQLNRPMQPSPLERLPLWPQPQRRWLTLRGSLVHFS